MFVDEVKIFVQAGKGGNGAVAFRREKFVPNGGPAGGDGGKGGSVIFEVDPGLNTLMDFRHQKHYRAQDGEPGGTNNMYGRDGEDIIVRVPPGTIVRSEQGELIADLTEPGQRAVIARGGRGGKGNSHFASSRHRAPRVAERGQAGEALWVTLELNLLADVGLVGFPNAGKSTLISVISAAKPKIADYPFTTLVPNLGVVSQYGDPFVVADVPGLIEGAHQGQGLGDTFLRHLNRTRVLLHLVDMDPQTGHDPVNDFRIIRHELEAFSPDLAARPRLIVATKMDVPGSQENLQRLQDYVAPLKVWPISSLTREGVDVLMWEVRKILDETPKPVFQKPEPVIKPVVRGFSLEPCEEGVRVVGDVEERAGMTLWGNRDAEEYFLEYLRRRGLENLLRRQQIPDGSAVMVGEGTFYWREGELVLE
ncbi:GTPase ObgE [Sulfobacillus thermosulfidooxidans]|uniref:GTPase ObgE n=1 Tax=Sulfobacillus thermosulfidooxidans TaxID=28034 RepID=UPI00096B7E23|nr:GTPase ObgE [Sulfobacillus thermosulfidooxidans]OLZ10829.1 GTPase ObgE [Sulfobacillus thermosulfidooxidans]OLZ14316.1 GTPase ObgE [Sulfobacillus thermosulfidooxidans]OLZ19059.1 GTPase ObgE [Sulfobacillus thermosulfidooxidans]